MTTNTSALRGRSQKYNVSDELEAEIQNSLRKIVSDPWREAKRLGLTDDQTTVFVDDAANKLHRSISYRLRARLYDEAPPEDEDDDEMFPPTLKNQVPV
jgi:hypothetical protein